MESVSCVCSPDSIVFNGTFLGVTFENVTGVDDLPGATRAAIYEFPIAGDLYVVEEVRLLSY